MVSMCVQDDRPLYIIQADTALSFPPPPPLPNSRVETLSSTRILGYIPGAPRPTTWARDPNQGDASSTAGAVENEDRMNESDTDSKETGPMA
jgi:hypothetical protein